MPDGRFLWVNKDPTSSSLSNSYKDDQVRHRIYSHVQVNGRHIQWRSKQAALVEFQATKTVTTVEVTKLPEARSDKHPRSRSPAGKKKRSTTKSVVVTKKDLKRIPTQICGKNESLDPFGCSAVKFDHNTYNLLQFYLEYTSLAPMAWESAPFRRMRSESEFDDANIVETCMGSKFHFYTFFSLVASIMEALGVSVIAPRLGPFYSYQALAEMQKQLGQDKVNDEELLYGVSRMSIAAALRNDDFGAQAHLRAAKHFVDKAGGFKALKPANAQRIRYADLHLAIVTLSAPIFKLALEPQVVHKQRHQLDPTLEKLGENALRLSRLHHPVTLYRAVRRTVHNIGILEGVWTHSSNPIPSIEWLASEALATLTQLLSTSFEAEYDTQLRKAREGAKIIMILWTLVLILFVKGTIADSTVKDSMPMFKDTILEARRESWPSAVYDGLLKWNLIVRSSPYSYGTKDRGTFLVLINVVRSMEVGSKVPLGDFMNRVFELEGLKRDRQVTILSSEP